MVNEAALFFYPSGDNHVNLSGGYLSLQWVYH